MWKDLTGFYITIIFASRNVRYPMAPLLQNTFIKFSGRLQHGSLLSYLNLYYAKIFLL